MGRWIHAVLVCTMHWVHLKVERGVCSLLPIPRCLTRASPHAGALLPVSMSVTVEGVKAGKKIGWTMGPKPVVCDPLLAGCCVDIDSMAR